MGRLTWAQKQQQPQEEKLWPQPHVGIFQVSRAWDEPFRQMDGLSCLLLLYASVV